MKAVKQHVAGGAQQLYIGQDPVPVPGYNEVLVQVVASAMNRADILQREGKYPPPPGASQVPGLELAGKVALVGANVSEWSAGDNVFGLVAGGAHAEYAVVHKNLLIRVPDELTFEECAAIPEVFLTAYQSLIWHGELREGEKVLIHAGGSGVGTAAIQIADRLGAEVFVTASESKHELCRQLGALAAVDYKKEHFWEILHELTGGVDLIVDPVGGSYFPKNLKLLKEDGRLVMLAVMGGMKTSEVNIGQIVFKRLRITGSTLRSRSVDYQTNLIRSFWEYAENEFITGRIKPVIDRVFDFDQIRLAHEYMEANLNTGKVLLKIA